MKKKIILILTAVLLLSSLSVFADEYYYSDTYYMWSEEQGEIVGTYDNMFENELYDVITEFEITEPGWEEVTEFKNVRRLVDSKQDENGEYHYYSKVEKLMLNYDGTYEHEVLCEETEDHDAAEAVMTEAWKAIGREYTFMNSDEQIFNDGLLHVYRDNDTNVLVDINGAEKFVHDNESWNYSPHTYEYNLGMLYECSAPSGFGMFSSDPRCHVTFKNLMTDGKEYNFNTYITNFNDDGYAIMYVMKEDKLHTYIVKLKKGIIPTVSYNGEKIKFDQIPVIENGRTLVPLRAIFEKIGATVGWDEATSTVTAEKDGVKVELVIDDVNAKKNDEAITLDVPAKLINGRTMVPVRFVSDCFGVNVEWDDAMQRVVLTSK